MLNSARTRRIAGRAPSGTFRYDGPAGGGALAAGEATLDARFPARGLTVAFAEGWPALAEGVAEVAFTARGFEAVVSGGRLGATAIQSTRVTIDDFGDAALTLGIALPLQTDSPADVSGTLTLTGASFGLDGFEYPLTGIDGVLAISEDGGPEILTRQD